MSQATPIHEGRAFQCTLLDNYVAELRFDLKDDSVNKFNALALRDLREAVGKLREVKNLKGLLLTSGKDVFAVGADVTEFLVHFKSSEEELTKWLLEVDRIFSDIEDLPVPCVAAINGVALGGAMEFVLSASFRVMSTQAKVGLPETKLGIFPGWGGTVRLSRLIGADNAIEWIAGGEQYKSDDALKVGAVDAVVAPENVRTAALAMLGDAISGKLDWKARRQEKISPLKLNPIEATMVFEGASAFVAAKAGPNYPAPLAAISVMKKGAGLGRDEALALEAKEFARIARTPVAASLVGLFLGDQYLKKVSKKLTKDAQKFELTAVLGAGIMGGGIAYQSASRGVPIMMKDITPQALELGLTEAVKLLDKQVSRGKLTTAGMAKVVAGIHSTLSYGDFKNVDLVVEAVVENEKVKRSVLAEVEAASKDGAILASNTSSISITKLSEALKHPENFCGMHFFNPVHRMPLVEVIRGKKSSERAVATTVAYALAMGKTPIVVNDCAGFFVNRVLFPYFGGFEGLLLDGVDFQRIDKVMEKFGWPMGPAYLLDVVGIDTANHADAVMAAAFPDRMAKKDRTATQAMFEAKRFGQKNGKGFYSYVPDKKGAPKKEVDPAAIELVKGIAKRSTTVPTVSDEDIVDRMMLPMILECSRCLEESIVATPVEVDLGLIYGLGFPPFRGGALRYADQLGAAELVKRAEKHLPLGKLYEPTAQLRSLAQSGKTFYPTT
jgi:3-hydroxyacyl-CoA dehydrogenase/enoyl-CoA hydratase/3-hydroxybutyryl-CoA epimerase/enoyl-CoA isomerase